MSSSGERMSEAARAFRWVERTAAPPSHLALLEKAVALHPGRGDALERYGVALTERQRHGEAIAPLEAALAVREGEFTAWRPLAAAYAATGRPQEALDAAIRGGITELRGIALLALGRVDEGRAILRADVLSGGPPSALTALMRALVREPDPAPVLEILDSLPPPLARTATARGYRAIALSRAGRHAEARRLVDLERHVLQIPFAPPAPFGDGFNDALAADILAMSSSADAARDGTDIRYDPPSRKSRALGALYAFVRSGMERWVGEMAARGLGAVMPPPPPSAQLYSANTILTGDGRNGEHIHGIGYVSAVYHVRVPAGDGGDLVLGCCARTTGGYAPCWGTRHITPREGCLTLFPSHVFHDVVPTGLATPRISVACDMIPLWDRS
jgi:hypothetical protein